MNRTLMDFCDTVRDRPSGALDTLLKIAETKDALLIWEQAFTLMISKDDRFEEPSCIASALALALEHVEQAEESILDAFCLSQQSQKTSKAQTA